MRGMRKRLVDLESSLPAQDSGRIDLDALTNDELSHLEAIAMNQEAGLTFEELPADELCFIANLPVVA